MRIKKQNSTSVSASQAIPSKEGQIMLHPASNDVKKACDEAIEYIHSAINVLATVAKEDKVAKDSIANLSVILLDLSSGDDSELPKSEGASEGEREPEDK